MHFTHEQTTTTAAPGPPLDSASALRPRKIAWLLLTLGSDTCAMVTDIQCARAGAYAAWHREEPAAERRCRAGRESRSPDVTTSYSGEAI